MQALKAGYDHHRAGGGGVLSSALKAVGTSTVDMGREAGRSAGEAVGLAKPTASERSTVGGRAAERREGMTAQLQEERAAMADAGGMSKGSESNPGGTGTSAEGDSAKNNSAGNKSTSAAPVVPPPATPSGAAGGAVGGLGGASAPLGGNPQVVDDYGNVVAPPAAKIAESNAGGAGTSATNTSAMNTSAGNTSATNTSAPSGGGSSAPAPGAGQSGPASGRDKTPFQDLQHVRPPQIPSDAAPQAGVNIRLSHSED